MPSKGGFSIGRGVMIKKLITGEFGIQAASIFLPLT